VLDVITYYDLKLGEKPSSPQIGNVDGREREMFTVTKSPAPENNSAMVIRPALLLQCGVEPLGAIPDNCPPLIFSLDHTHLHKTSPSGAERIKSTNHH
jgi:hypothetical protein